MTHLRAGQAGGLYRISEQADVAIEWGERFRATHAFEGGGQGCALEGADGCGWLRQRARNAAATPHGGLRPDELFHRVFGLDPGAARLAPAGGGGDGEFQALGIGGADGVGEGVFPVRRHVNKPLGHDLRRFQAGVEILDAADSHARHPIEILVDPFLCDVAVHPVPPDARPGALRWVMEAVREIIRQQRTGEGGAGEQQRKAKGAGLHAGILWINGR